MSDLNGVLDVTAWTSQLSAPARRLRDAVYEYPGSWFDLAVAGAAAGLSEDEVHRSLPALAALGAVRCDQGRWYLPERTAAEVAPSPQAAARIASWYLHTGYNALTATGYNVVYLPLADLEPGVRPGRFADFRAAHTWVAEQRENALAVLHACAGHEDAAAWQLAMVLSALLVLDNDQDSWREAIEVGVFAARRERDVAAEGFLLEYAGKLYSQSGQSEAGAAVQRCALALRTRIGDLPGQARSHNALALIAQREHDHPTAAARLSEALRIAQQLGDERFAAIIRLNQVALLTTSGRASEAAGLIEAVVQDLRRFALPCYEVSGLQELARIQAAAGDLDAAQATAAQAVEQAEMLGAVPNLAWALMTQADVIAAAGRREHALQAARQAAAYFRAVSDRQRFALALRRGAALHRQGGQSAQAEVLEQHAARLEADLRAQDALGPEPYLLTGTCGDAPG